ncbi:SEFIR domain-containing protein [Amycolatopsis sp. YIM 10]|uniref:SEFIR domain-containing protein n=1 Tax=Amycolatopsis sp. YIM 10 TaxID=2653857 RepID=UPI0012902EAB
MHSGRGFARTRFRNHCRPSSASPDQSYRNRGRITKQGSALLSCAMPFREHPPVFVSYTHDSEYHCRRVEDFASFLAGKGIEPIIDVWANVRRKDWYAWMLTGLEVSSHVIVIASEGYRRMGDGTGPADRNRGGQWEAALLRDFLQGDRPGWTAKILPVILPGQHIDGIPRFLQPYAADHYVVTEFTEAGAEQLLRAITEQPGHVPPPLGQRPHLPPRSGPGAQPELR